MATITEMSSRLADQARTQRDRYAGGADRPLGGYIATMSFYSALVGSLAAAARLSHRELPDWVSPLDVVLGAAATHKLSRLPAKDSVTSPLRAPFTSCAGVSGPAELQEEVRGHGAQKTIGELVNCPFCTSVWIATGLTAGLVFAPRATRLVTAMQSSLAGADLLHFGHALLEQAAEH
ncbi:MAG: DUF1360 domain-containing protein [Streptosporangiaceae bacterium]|jgi:hypothetical protein